MFHVKIIPSMQTSSVCGVIRCREGINVSPSPDNLFLSLKVGNQGKFMKESYPRKWVLEPGHPQADGFCIFAGARFLAAVKCRIRFSVGWFWAAQSLVWT